MNNDKMVSVPFKALRDFLEHSACTYKGPEWTKNKAALRHAMSEQPSPCTSGDADYSELKRLASGAVNSVAHWGRNDQFIRYMGKLVTPELVLALISDHDELVDLRASLVERDALLKRTLQFVINGVELGYIRMPDADTPDPAHDLVPMIDAALSASADPRSPVSAPFPGYPPVPQDRKMNDFVRLNSAPHCPECGHPDCNGQCYGDDMMGDS